MTTLTGSETATVVSDRIYCPACPRSFVLPADGNKCPYCDSSLSNQKTPVAAGRQRILELARGAQNEDLINCPVCNVSLKTKSLVRHYDKLHAGTPVSDALPSDSKPQSPATVTSRQATGDESGGPSKITRSSIPQCSELLELATPRIYRRNLFRVLGLAVSATPKDVQRQQNRRKMQEKLGIASPNGQDSPLTLKPIPTAEDVRAAMKRLNRPLDRLLDEIFWFWPTDPNTAVDPALEALANDDIKSAAKLWMEQVNCGEDGQIAAHNLAVLDHLIALDYESRLGSQELNHKQQKHLADLWLRVFARWRQVLDGEEFWRVVRDRVRELDDKQLTTGFVRRIRSTLPTALLLINGKIAYAAAERFDTALTQRHIGILGEAGFGGELADEAVRESLKPIRNRITIAIDNAKSRWTNAPQRGNQHVRELYDHATSLLAVADMVLAPGNLARAGMHDAVAEAMLEGQVAFGNKTNDWLECIKLLDLAQGLAAGDSVKSRLSENRKILLENDETGNNWCAPGYWDLPGEILAQLESTRGKSDSGDYEGAIAALIVLDPKIGKPLRRCFAYCLSLKGVCVGNDALSEHNAETGVLKKILANLGALGESNLMVRLSIKPDPSPYTSVPPCLCCNSTYYTSWTTFTFKDVSMFMCSACAERHEREQAEKKRVLRKHIATALEYLLLANEVDHGNKGVQRNLKTVKETASGIDCNIPKTKALKKRLGAKTTRRTRQTFEPTAEDRICHFCGENASDDSCGITLPMCGNMRTIDLLLHKGIEYYYADIVVPRCRRCRDEHRELPSRIEKWHEARLNAASDHDHPEIVQDIGAAARAARAANARVDEQKLKVVEAEKAVAEAEEVGEQCDRCNSKIYWRSYLCSNCDSEVKKLGTESKWSIALAAIGTLAATVYLENSYGLLTRLAELSAGAAGLFAFNGIPIAILVSAAVAGSLKVIQWRRRRVLRKLRKTEIEERRNIALGEAQMVLDQATSSLELAKEAAQEPARALEDAQNRHEAVEGQAIAEFERVYPQPRLATGVKPEATYPEFCRIRDLCGREWGFGHTLDGDGKPAGVGRSDDVVGLVAREPRLATERIVVNCPKCGKRQRMPEAGHLIEVKCPCGHIFERLNRMMQEPDIPGSSSSKPAKGRDRIRLLARQAGAEKMIECPVCGSPTKAKNLIRHYDKLHKGSDVPDSVESRCPNCDHSWPWDGTKCKYCGHSKAQVGASREAGQEATKSRKSASKPKNASGTPTGRCPECGFSYKWNGSSCDHCGYGGGVPSA